MGEASDREELAGKIEAACPGAVVEIGDPSLEWRLHGAKHQIRMSAGEWVAASVMTSVALECHGEIVAGYCRAFNSTVAKREGE